MEYNPLKQYGLTLHEDTPDTSTPVAKMLPSAVAYHYANLFLAAPELYEALREADTVICQLCKRLNPQHAQSPYKDSCDWCQDRDGRLQALAKAEGK